MINRALILDLETSGPNPQTDRIIELGLILYSVPAQTSLMQFSALIPHTDNAAEHINAISVDALLASLEVTIDVQTIALQMLDLADVIVAHNGTEFDRVFLGEPWSSKRWLCTKSDFAWPKGRPGDSLVNLALAHGIGVSSAHRALTDCQLIAALFDRMHFFGVELQPLFADAMRPKVLYRAMVEYDERHLAKNAGFSWDAQRRWWLRWMPEEAIDRLPFNVARIEVKP